MPKENQNKRQEGLLSKLKCVRPKRIQIKKSTKHPKAIIVNLKEIMKKESKKKT